MSQLIFKSEIGKNVRLLESDSIVFQAILLCSVF